jgi:hypothetical protein
MTIIILIMISFILLMPVTKSKNLQTYTKEEIQKLKYDRKQ